MMDFRTLLFCVFLIVICNIKLISLDSNQVDCADESCSVPIGSGMAQTIISSNVEGYVGMRKGEEGQIFGVVGKDLFLVETQTKKRGFVSQKLFREMRLKRKDLVKSNLTIFKGRFRNQIDDSLIPEAAAEVESFLGNNINDNNNGNTNSEESIKIDIDTTFFDSTVKERIDSSDEDINHNENQSSNTYLVEAGSVNDGQKPQYSYVVEETNEVAEKSSNLVVDLSKHTVNVINETNGSLDIKLNAIDKENSIADKKFMQEVTDSMSNKFSPLDNAGATVKSRIDDGKDPLTSIKNIPLNLSPYERVQFKKIDEDKSCKIDFMSFDSNKSKKTINSNTVKPPTSYNLSKEYIEEYNENLTGTPKPQFTERDRSRMARKDVSNTLQPKISSSEPMHKHKDVPEHFKRAKKYKDSSSSQTSAATFYLSQLDLNQKEQPDQVDQDTLAENKVTLITAQGSLDNLFSTELTDEKFVSTIKSAKTFKHVEITTTGDKSNKLSKRLNKMQESSQYGILEIELQDKKEERDFGSQTKKDIPGSQDTCYGQNTNMYSTLRKASNQANSLTVDTVFDEMMHIVVALCIIAFVVIVFLNMKYCLRRCDREKLLTLKLNSLEVKFMAILKENKSMKQDNKNPCTKENQDTMRSELKEKNVYEIKLKEEVDTLQNELMQKNVDNERLRTQIIELSVDTEKCPSNTEEVDRLHKQISEQRLKIESLKESLVNRSMEYYNSQQELNNINLKLNQEMKLLKNSYDDVELEKICVENELKNLRKQFEGNMQEILSFKDQEIERLLQKLLKKEKEAVDFHQKYRTSEIKIQLLTDNVAKLKQMDSCDIFEVVDAKADLILLSKDYESMKNRFNTEVESKIALEKLVENLSSDVIELKAQNETNLKREQETQTKLDVLTTYFKEKENDLQRELNAKEAIWLKQQGETTSTVERIRTMQEEIQHLRSQNDSLKSEIISQDASYKTQMVDLENKSHTSWLNARQFERKVEELRNETTLLRRRLTSMVEINPNSIDASINNNMNRSGVENGVEKLSSDLLSPTRAESPKGNMMTAAPSIPFIPPPPFMAPIPLPPFLPKELAHIGHFVTSSMNSGYTPPAYHHDRDRLSVGSRFRDDYSVMTPYDTETDFSPPNSPVRNTSLKRDRSSGGFS